MKTITNSSEINSPSFSANSEVIIKNIKNFVRTYNTNLPGIVNFFTLPFEFFKAKIGLAHAKAIHDKEGELDYAIKMIGMPANFLHSASKVATTVIQVGGLLGAFHIKKSMDWLGKITPAIAAAGVGLCLVEFFFETRNALRQKGFLSDFSKPILQSCKKTANWKSGEKKRKEFIKLSEKALKEYQHIFKRNPDLLLRLKAVKIQFETAASETDEGINAFLGIAKEIDYCSTCYNLNLIQKKYLTILPQSVENIKKFVTQSFSEFSEEKKEAKVKELTNHMLEGKFAKLSRRIHPWAAQELANKIPALLEKVSSINPKIREEGLAEANELLEMAKIQAKKKLIVHIISLVAICLSCAGLLVTGIGAPFGVALGLLFGGGLIAKIGLIYSLGSSNSRKWTFTPSHIIPDWIKRRFAKVFTEKSSPMVTPKQEEVRPLTLLEIAERYKPAHKFEARIKRMAEAAVVYCPPKNPLLYHVRKVF